MLHLFMRKHQKLHALSRIAHHMDSEKLEHVIEAFIFSKLNYCPLVWMHNERGLYSKINYLHKKLHEMHAKMSFLTLRHS